MIFVWEAESGGGVGEVMVMSSVAMLLCVGISQLGHLNIVICERMILGARTF